MLARLFKKLFRRNDPAREAPPARPLSPPPPVMPPTAASPAAPPPPPPPPASTEPEPEPQPQHVDPALESAAVEGSGETRVKLVMADGTTATPGLDAEAEERLRYILDNIVPPSDGPAT